LAETKDHARNVPGVVAVVNVSAAEARQLAVKGGQRV